MWRRPGVMDAMKAMVSDVDNETSIQLVEAARGNFCDLGGHAHISP